MTERFICPKTEDNCAYAGYCSAEKITMDRGGPSSSSPQGRIMELMPDEVTEVMSGFCADERILALNGLVDTTTNERVRNFASIRSEQISTSESFFNGGK